MVRIPVPASILLVILATGEVALKTARIIHLHWYCSCCFLVTSCIFISYCYTTKEENLFVETRNYFHYYIMFALKFI